MYHSFHCLARGKLLRQRKRGDREEWSGEEDEWARGAGKGWKVARWGRRGGRERAESCAVEQEGAAEEGSGGANNACNFWGRVVRESPILYDFVYYKAIFMEL